MQRGEAGQAKTPNVLFLFSDQQRWDTVGCYGEPLGNCLNLTPNLDRLAAEGVRFQNAYSVQPVCGPARTCIQTGRWPTEIACYVNDRMLPPGQKCVAEYFNDAGYETAYVGKWNLASQYTYSGDYDDPRRIDFGIKPVPSQLRGGYKDYWVAADLLESTSHGYGGVLFDGTLQKREFIGYRADALTDYALAYLERPRSKPFFLFIS